MSREYNGWTNYETWCVNLWLDNEPGSYEEKLDIIRQAKSPSVAADALMDWVHEMAPDLRATLWADLLGAALSEVNWDEIAEVGWNDLHEDDEADDP